MSLKQTLVLASFLLIALSGCVDSEEAPEETTTTGTAQDGFDENGNVTQTFGPHSGLPLERPADWTPRLDQSPEWVQGEWWTFDLQSHLDGSSFSNTRVVAGKEGADYLVGMPLEDFSDGVMIMHIPGFGLVNSDSLGFEAHDVMFDMMSFPLEESKTWTSSFEAPGQQITFLVEEIKDNQAHMSISGALGGGSAIYDAELGAVTYFELLNYAKYEITGHGFGYEGTVRVPHSHDLIFFHGRLAQVADLTLGPAPLPLETITIPEGYDRVSFALIFQDIVAGATGVGSGLFQVDATAPNGETYTAQKLPTDGAPFKVEMFANDEPAGDWNLQYIAAGAGGSFIEGIGYITFDVELPSGCVLLTSSVHNHGGECGGHVHDIE